MLSFDNYVVTVVRIDIKDRKDQEKDIVDVMVTVKPINIDRKA